MIAKVLSLFIFPTILPLSLISDPYLQSPPPLQPQYLTASSYKEAPWINLLDNNLSKWENYLSYRHKLGYNGKKPVDDAGKEIIPIGYNKDEQRSFQW